MSLDEMDLAAEATSMHQSVEWGMRAFQALFPRDKHCIEFEELDQQKLMIKLMILLYNLQARGVGINQILYVYMPSLDVNANELYE